MRPSRHVVLLVLAAALAVVSTREFCAAPAAKAPVNLVSNPGFEEDMLGMLSMWTTNAWVNTDSAVRFFTTEQRAHSGRRSFAIANLQKNDSKGIQWVIIKPNTLYRLSAWIMAQDVASDGVGANISVLGSTSAAGDLKDTGGKWSYVEMYGRTQPKQTSLAVTVRLGFYGSLATGIAFFDDVKLEEAAALPAGAREINLGANEAGEIFPMGPAGEAAQKAAEAQTLAVPWLVVVIMAILAAAVSVVAGVAVILMLRGRAAGTPAQPRGSNVEAKAPRRQRKVARTKTSKSRARPLSRITGKMRAWKWPWNRARTNPKEKKLLPVTYTLMRSSKADYAPAAAAAARPKKPATASAASSPRRASGRT